MSSLSIRFANDFYTVYDAQSPVEVIGPDGRIQRRAMSLGRGLDVDVPPGDYLVRLFLPSGEIITERAEVRDLGGAVRLQSAETSAQESMAWAYYLKGAQRAEGAGRLDELESFGPKPLSVTLEVWRHPPDGEWVLDQSAGAVTEDRTALDLDRNLLLAATVVCNAGVQNWLAVRGPGVLTKYVALPGSGPVNVMVRTDERPAGPASPLTVLVQLADQRAEAILQYLARGAFTDAGTAGEDFSQHAAALLSNERGDPYGAAVGGYFLLRAGRTEQYHDWVAELADRIAWLPDGPVIHAWHTRQAGRDPGPLPFRDRLLEAERRGLPLFSQGVRLLVDGLRQLNRRDETDFEVERALGRVSDYAAALDRSASITRFGGEHPASPRRSLPTEP